jgi:hypothetical protein
MQFARGGYPQVHPSKNENRVREMLYRRFREADLAQIEDPVRDQVVSAYVRSGRCRIYARGGFPAPKVPETDGDIRRMEAAIAKRVRRALVAEKGVVCRAVGETLASMKNHLRTKKLMNWEMTREEREAAHAFGIFK